MSDITLRQRSTTELVDAAFQVFRREPGQFIVAAALIYVPWLVLRVVLDIGVNPDVAPSVWQSLVLLAGSVAVYTLAGGVTAVLASDVYLDQPADLARAFGLVAKRIVPLVVTMIITTVAIIFFAIFLLLPALYPIARFFAARQVILLEHGGVGAALSRSSYLSVDIKRHILNTLLLIGLITIAITFGSTMLTTMIGSRLMQQVVATAISAAVYPLLGITETLLYYDVRIRKEGFDVEYLAGSVEAPAPAGM